MQQTNQPAPKTSSSDGGSSPLIPILIAIAVLAALSAGVVMMRNKRQGKPGAPVSDEGRLVHVARGRKVMIRKLRVFTAPVLAAAVASMAFASAAQAVPATFWGVVPQTTPSADQLQRLKRGGVDSTRIPIPWDAVEPAKGGALNWSGVDPQESPEPRPPGIDVLPFIYGAPSWVVANVAVPGSGGSVKAPKFLPVKTGAQRSAWASFLAQVVARYGSNGSFWALNPAVPKRPIRIWQIWNEALNFKYFVVRPEPGRLRQAGEDFLRGAAQG